MKAEYLKSRIKINCGRLACGVLGDSDSDSASRLAKMQARTDRPLEASTDVTLASRFILPKAEGIRISGP